METQVTSERFAEDGVLALPGFFSDADLAEVRTTIAALLVKHPPQPYRSREYADLFDTDVHCLAEAAMNEPAFTALREHPRLRAAQAALLGADYIDEYLLVQVTANATGQAWHQDTPCDAPERFNVNCLIYPFDVSEESGAVGVVPGSHRRGPVPPGGHQDAIPGEVVLTPRAGTLLFLDTRCWHRVGRNRRVEPRVSINYRIRPPACPPGYTAKARFRNAGWDFAAMKPIDPATG